jgi:hypothetical protein
LDERQDSKLDASPIPFSAQLPAPDVDEMAMDRLTDEVPDTPQAAVSFIGWIGLVFAGLVLWYLVYRGIAS